MRTSTRRSLFSALAGIIVFIASLFLKMPLPLGGLVAILMYFATYYLMKGKVIFSGTAVDLSMTQEEFDALMREMARDMDILEKVSRNAPNEDVRGQARSLYDKAMSIIKYINWHPQSMEELKDFFRRDLSNAADIATSYMRFMDLGVDKQENSSIHLKTRDSMMKLNEDFSRHLSSLTSRVS